MGVETWGWRYGGPQTNADDADRLGQLRSFTIRFICVYLCSSVASRPMRGGYR